MAQTAAKKVSGDCSFDYTPATAKTAGVIVEIGTRAFPVDVDLAANELGALSPEGVWDVPKASGAISSGTDVYWDNDGSPNTGDASSGAATTTSSTNTYLGRAVADAGSSDTYVRVRLGEGPTSTSLPVFTPEVVAAAGSTQTDATSIGATTGFAHCTGADATKGVKLPAATAGKVVYIKNSDAANAVLKVWPATGDAINAIAANSSLSMAAKTSAVFVAVDATTWYTIPLVPS